jgi:hypothetical protein
VSAGTPLIAIHARSETDIVAVRPMVIDALTITDAAPAPRPLILDRLGLARTL